MIQVKPLGWIAKISDLLMLPVMWLLTGIGESPQKTHRWNNTKLSYRDVVLMQHYQMVECRGITGEKSRWFGFIPIFHIPLLGWRHYVVIKPPSWDGEWHIGWISEDVIGVSQIKLRGPVRVLIGPTNVKFFGITVDGTQIILNNEGSGKIGDGGPFSRVPLL